MDWLWTSMKCSTYMLYYHIMISSLPANGILVLIQNVIWWCIANFPLSDSTILEQVFIIISFWIRCYPRRRGLPDFVWSLSLSRLSISIGHMHPFLPGHFSSFHSPCVFSTYASMVVFVYNRTLLIPNPSLSHFHHSSKHDRIPPHTTYFCQVLV